MNQMRHVPRIITRKKQQVGSASPRFSVILCTLNRRNFVLSALTSLSSQTLPYADFEVIVVDNGSRDGTLGAVRSYAAKSRQRGKLDDPWRILCLYEPRNGLAHARNTGLLAATGEIAVFVDDDTLIDARMLENLWQAYQETHADAIAMRV